MCAPCFCALRLPCARHTARALLMLERLCLVWCVRADFRHICFFVPPPVARCGHSGAISSVHELQRWCGLHFVSVLFPSLTGWGASVGGELLEWIFAEFLACDKRTATQPDKSLRKTVPFSTVVFNGLNMLETFYCLRGFLRPFF